MNAKTQHNNILLAIVGFAAVVVIVAIIGFFALDRGPELVQGQVEVSEYRVSSKVPYFGDTGQGRRLCQSR